MTPREISRARLISHSNPSQACRLPSIAIARAQLCPKDVETVCKAPQTEAHGFCDSTIGCFDIENSSLNSGPSTHHHFE